MIAITPPIIFSKEVAQNRPPHFLARASLGTRNYFTPNFQGWGLDENLKPKSPPYGGPHRWHAAVLRARSGASILHCPHDALHAAALPLTTVQEKCITYTVGDAQAGFIRMKSTSKKRTPSIGNLTVKRRYLTEREIERLMDCARKHGRYGHRDATMILVAYRHGLRASEVCDLQWQQIELSEGRLHVHRVKNGIPSVHPIRGDEMRALRKLRRDYPKDAYVFVSERGGPIGPIGFHRLIQRVGEAANMPFPIHPHMLRHACGFKLANDGHDTRALQHYLGHKNIQHTVRYTEMAPDRFKDFWRD